jgi:hypothetical protein
MTVESGKKSAMDSTEFTGLFRWVMIAVIIRCERFPFGVVVWTRSITLWEEEKKQSSV